MGSANAHPVEEYLGLPQVEILTTPPPEKTTPPSPKIIPHTERIFRETPVLDLSVLFPKPIPKEKLSHQQRLENVLKNEIWPKTIKKHYQDLLENLTRQNVFFDATELADEMHKNLELVKNPENWENAIINLNPKMHPNLCDAMDRGANDIFALTKTKNLQTNFATITTSGSFRLNIFIPINPRESHITILTTEINELLDEAEKQISTLKKLNKSPAIYNIIALPNGNFITQSIDIPASITPLPDDFDPNDWPNSQEDIKIPAPQFTPPPQRQNNKTPPSRAHELY